LRLCIAASVGAGRATAARLAEAAARLAYVVAAAGGVHRGAVAAGAARLVDAAAGCAAVHGAHHPGPAADADANAALHAVCCSAASQVAYVAGAARLAGPAAAGALPRLQAEVARLALHAGRDAVARPRIAAGGRAGIS